MSKTTGEKALERVTEVKAAIDASMKKYAELQQTAAAKVESCQAAVETAMTGTDAAAYRAAVQNLQEAKAELEFYAEKATNRDNVASEYEAEGAQLLADLEEYRTKKRKEFAKAAKDLYDQLIKVRDEFDEENKRVTKALYMWTCSITDLYPESLQPRDWPRNGHDDASERAINLTNVNLDRDNLAQLC